MKPLTKAEWEALATSRLAELDRAHARIDLLERAAAEGVGALMTRIENLEDTRAKLESEVEELAAKVEGLETEIETCTPPQAPHTGRGCSNHCPINPWECAGCVAARGAM